MTIFNPLTEAQFLIQFDKFGSFFFTEKSGGDWEAESSEYANGAGMDIYTLTGPRKVTPITLKAPFDPTFQAQLDPVIFYWGCTPGIITITPVDCHGGINTTVGGTNNSLGVPGLVQSIAVGTPYTYTGCRIKKYMVPKVDRKSATAAMIELEFTVNNLTRGTSGTAASFVPTTSPQSTSSTSTIDRTIQDLLKPSGNA